MPFRDPEKARNYQREYRRTRRVVQDCTSSSTTQIPISFRLQTAQDVIDLLEGQISAVIEEGEAGTLEKARTIGYLATVALKAIEAGNIVARIEELEAILKRRKGST
jgi:hypothetical protein